MTGIASSDVAIRVVEGTAGEGGETQVVVARATSKSLLLYLSWAVILQCIV